MMKLVGHSGFLTLLKAVDQNLSVCDSLYIYSQDISQRHAKTHHQMIRKREYSMLVGMWWDGYSYTDATQCEARAIKALMQLPQVFLLFGIPHKEVIRNRWVHKNLCSSMFIAALFMAMWYQKLPTCLTIGKWLNKLWHNPMVKYYSALKVWFTKNFNDKEKQLWYDLGGERLATA